MSQQTAPTTARTIGARSYVLGALGGGIRGYELGVIAGAQLFLVKDLHIGTQEHLGVASIGWVVASALIGSLLGAPASGPLADRFGRRAMIAAAGLLYTVGIVIAALAGNFTTLILGRVVLGVAVGIATAMIPVYLGEIAPARLRGGRASLFQLMITTGVLLASIVSYTLADSGEWRWMFAIGAFPAALMFAGALFLPESPRWLVSKGRDQDARAVLGHSREPHEVDAEIAAIKQINEDRRRQLGLGALLGSPALRKLLLVGSVLGIFQQFIGINAVTYYAPKILTTIGYSDSASILAGVGFSSLALVFTGVMVFFVVDRFGRRKPLMMGAVGMAAAMLILGIVFSTSGAHKGASGWVAIVCLAFFQIMFALSWGGIVWTVLGEMYPLRVRGTAMGIATLLTELASVVVSLYIPGILQSSGSAIFYGFGGMGVLALLWVVFVLPETGNRSLEDLEGLLAPEHQLAPVAPAPDAALSQQPR